MSAVGVGVNPKPRRRCGYGSCCYGARQLAGFSVDGGVSEWTHAEVP